MRNIILIGMPTSGKSTAGVILAKVLGMRFIDTDLLIQERAGKKLSEIIPERGLDGFLELERDICLTVDAENTVIATGGSVIYHPETMEHFRDIGTVVYLEITFEELTKRLGDVRQRGVVLRRGQTVEDLFRERVPLYERYADIRITEGPGGIEETVRKIAAAAE